MSMKKGELLMSNEENLLLWLDLETTGSDYRRDHILEVGAILTDWNLSPVGIPFESLVRLPLSYDMDTMDPVVKQMHTDNGLWDDLRYGAIHTITSIELHLLTWISLYTRTPVVLAGSGVSHFDSRFIEKYMPRTWSNLKGFDSTVKPTLDIGVLRRFFKFMDLNDVLPESTDDPWITVPPGPRDKPHRALYDVKQFINQAKTYRSILQELRLVNYLADNEPRLYERLLNEVKGAEVNNEQSNGS